MSIDEGSNLFKWKKLQILSLGSENQSYAIRGIISSLMRGNVCSESQNNNVTCFLCALCDSVLLLVTDVASCMDKEQKDFQ
jgi:hypothetical protein